MSTSISSVMSYFKNREEIFHSTVHESNFLIRSLFTSLVRRNLTLKSTFFSTSSYSFFFFFGLISLSNVYKNVERCVMQKINISQSFCFVLINVSILDYSCNCIRRKKIISASEEATRAFGFIHLMI